ncbi:hypothetical protein [Mesorhizobium australafricanum]|uniref:Uncharacterized protein n=1 Tax=Mesorhizobium australafricanum TaxID=3072311 RepID=A0ABU4X0F3_9HYPH|nr:MULTISPECIES: hypothetical protein [unclassified Mesorhizobium]MDX8441790.1 hypothetical protein [Mesorhizobium sp. VK3E]MDX8453508.1 hypothetical protein [Mesorhizobium sp. VK9D]
MSYIQNAQTARKGQRLTADQSWRPAYGGTFAYIVFALAFVFTGAVVMGLIP